MMSSLVSCFLGFDRRMCYESNWGGCEGWWLLCPCCVCMCIKVCVCACVSPLIKPVSGLVIKMHYHPTVSREETNSLSLCLLSLSHSYSLFHILPDSISSGKCRGGGHGGGSLSFFPRASPHFFVSCFSCFILLPLFTFSYCVFFA